MIKKIFLISLLGICLITVCVIDANAWDFKSFIRTWGSYNNCWEVAGGGPDDSSTITGTTNSINAYLILTNPGMDKEVIVGLGGSISVTLEDRVLDVLIDENGRQWLCQKLPYSVEECIDSEFSDICGSLNPNNKWDAFLKFYGLDWDVVKNNWLPSRILFMESIEEALITLYLPNKDVTSYSELYRCLTDEDPTAFADDGEVNYLCQIDGEPFAFDDTYTVNKNILNVKKPGVLSNDYDPNDDPLTAKLVSYNGNGTLILNLDGSFSYTPEVGFVGEDVFKYVNNDGNADSNVATVVLTVN